MNAYDSGMKVLPLRFIIADDHLISRQTLRRCIEESSDFVCLDDVKNGEEVLKLLEHSNPDVLVLDYMMPKLDGVQTLLRLRHKQYRVPVVVLTMHSHPHIMYGLIEAGVNAILMKGEATVEEVQNAMRSVVQFGHYYNDYFNEAVITTFRKEKRTHAKRSLLPYASLSERELKVLRLVCDGYNSDEIGEKIFASARTIDRIRMKLLKKTGTKNPIGLVVFAMLAGIYTPEIHNSLK